MLVVGTLADGGTASPLVLVFFIPVVFSSMSYPLGSVVVVGVLSVVSYLTLAVLVGGSSTEYQVSFAAALAGTAAMSAWQAHNHNRQHRALAEASRTDPLTGCLNRRGFEERAIADIASMTRSSGHGAIVVLDIDQFKPVNDMFGHAAGDELLCWVTQTLQRVVRSADAVGRLGGDEFAVLLPEIDAEQAHASALRIAEALRERAPASVGLALFPIDGTRLDELTRCADVRLYASREERPRAAHAIPAQSGCDPESPMQAPGRPQRGFGATELWRAALDAMPVDATHGRRQGYGSLQASLLDQIDASVIVTDMTGVVLYWNRGAEGLYGWRGEEAIGRSARDLVVPEDARASERLAIELSRDGHWDGELLVRRKDHSLFTVYVRNRLVQDAEGNPAAIMGVAVDISARVAAETELLQSRDYAQAVTECMGEALLMLDVDGRITYLNRTAETLLGWPTAELQGETIGSRIYALEADGAPRLFEDSAIGRALHREVTVRVDEDVFIAHSGRELAVAYTAAPFHTGEALRGCVVIFRDISERKRREAEHLRDVKTLACIDRVERALAEDRFVLHAQPILDLGSGETVQHELLLRMREPDGRLVAPAAFLPVAEKYAMIGEIDWWVIRQAAELAGSGCPVALNVSARSVGDLDMLEHIERCIEQCEVLPGSLIFEMTETAIVEDQRAARRFTERLHQLGCEVALDDFGTGYGTLTYLKQIPVDYLKLDIEFVGDLATNVASRHVVQAVVALARDFGLQTIGEGVEHAETLLLLRELGVDFAQGFHIGRPEPFADRHGDRRVTSKAQVLAEPKALSRPRARSRPAHAKSR